LAEFPPWHFGFECTRVLRVDRSAEARLSYLSATAALRGRRCETDGATSGHGAAVAVSFMGMATWERRLLYVVATLFLLMLWRWIP